MEYDEVCKRLENDPEVLAFIKHSQTEKYELKEYCASLEARIATLWTISRSTFSDSCQKSSSIWPLY